MTDDTHAAEAASLGHRVRRGVMWSGASALLMRVANLAIMAAAARLLIPEDFGVFAVAITVHMVIASIGELGVGAVLIREESDPDEVASTIAALSIVTGIFLGATMVLFAQPIASALGAPDAAAPVRVLALAVVLGGFFAVPGALLAREFRQDRIFVAAVAGFVPANALLLLMAAMGGGALSFAWSRVLGTLVTGLVMVACVSRHYWPAIRRGVPARVLRFGLPVMGANMLSWVLLNADFAVIGRTLGPVQLGFYMLAFNISSWSTSLVSATINSVAMPAFSRFRDDPVALRRAVRSATRAVGLIAFPMAALTLVLASSLVETVYGAKWAAAAPVLAMLSIYGAGSVVCLLFSSLLIGQGRPRLLLALQLMWLAFLVPALVVGAHEGGIVGAGIGHLVVVLGVVLPIYLIALKRCRIIGPLSLVPAVAPPLAAAAVAACAAALVARAVATPAVELLLGGAAGVLVYLLAVAPLMRAHVVQRLGDHRTLGGAARAYAAVGGRLALEKQA